MRRRSGKASTAEARTRILDAAMHLFAERGYSGTPTKAIAERAEVASGLVFYHFPTKRALLDALIAERSFAPQLRELLAEADPDDPRGTAVTILRRLFAMLAEQREMASIVVQASQGSTPGWVEFAELFRAEIDATGDYLSAAVGPERLDRQHARTMAKALLATGFFCTIMVPDEDPDRFVQDLVDVMLHGYLP